VPNPNPNSIVNHSHQPRPIASKPIITTAVIPTASMMYHSSEDIDTSMETEDEDDYEAELEHKSEQQDEVENVAESKIQNQNEEHIAGLISDDKNIEQIQVSVIHFYFEGTQIIIIYLRLYRMMIMIQVPLHRLLEFPHSLKLFQNLRQVPCPFPLQMSPFHFHLNYHR
jgi:hypothetical protein